MLAWLCRAARRPAAPAVAVAVAVAAAGTGLTGSPLHGAGPAAAATPTTQTAVMGPNVLTATQLAAWYQHKRDGRPANVPALGDDVRALAQIFIDEGRADGVRGDIAFVQSMIETGWLSFPSDGQIRPSFNNFAGLYAYNGRADGTTCAAETSPSRCFATPTLGVRTQIQLLRGYADSSTRSMSRLIHPPSDRIGIAPYWERFGGQQSPIVWATASNYGLYIVGLYSDALVHSGVVSRGCLPYYQGGTGRTAGNGYWLFGRDGSVYPVGSAPNLGNGRVRAIGTLVDAVANPSRSGYWMLGANGGIYAFGSAGWQGSTKFLKLWAPVISLAASAGGRGYSVAASDGGVFTFGDAPFFGSLGGKPLGSPIAAIERTASGKGYWLLSAEGGVYRFGDAVWYGSARALKMRTPFVDMVRTPSGRGYFLLQRDGRVRAYGDARYSGSLGGCGLGRVARLVPTATSAGYWIVTTSGAVAAFGDARPLGMPASTNRGIAALALQS